MKELTNRELTDLIDGIMEELDKQAKEIAKLKKLLKQEDKDTIQSDLGITKAEFVKLLERHRTNYKGEDVPDSALIGEKFGKTTREINAIRRKNGLWKNLG